MSYECLSTRKYGYARLCERGSRLKALSNVANVRHEVAPMLVSTAKAAMRPAVSPAASYQDMRLW